MAAFHLIIYGRFWVITEDITADCPSCSAGVIAWVNTSRVDCMVECQRGSCITLNSVPTLLSSVEYVCRNVCLCASQIAFQFPIPELRVSDTFAGSLVPNRAALYGYAV